MSFNLIDLIKGQFTEQLQGQLLETLGGSSEQNSTALNSAIPGLLSGLMNSGSSIVGGSSLLGAINSQDDSVLENIGSLLSSNQQSAVMNAGSNILGSQLGASGLSSLISAVASFSNLDKLSVKSLLGLLTPMVLSLIKRQLLSKGEVNLDSLTSLFQSQKKNIASAMPKDFQQQLDTFGFTNNIASNAKDMSQTIILERPSLLNKLFPAALILATVLLAYNVFLKNSLSPKDTQITPSTKEEQRINEQLSSVMGTLSNSLSEISDTESAQAVLPQLEEANTKLSSIASVLRKLPVSVQQPASNLVAESSPKIIKMLNHATAIPEIANIIQPVSGNLLESMASFEQ